MLIVEAEVQFLIMQFILLKYVKKNVFNNIAQKDLIVNHLIYNFIIVKKGLNV